MGSLQAIRYQRGSLELLDQLRLPFESVFIPIKSCNDAFLAIKDMNVRGAPAIAISAVLSLAVDLSGGGIGRFATKEEAVKYVKDQLAYLVTSRPTAVNLADAAQKIGVLADKAAENQPDADSVVLRVVEAAEAMLEDDVAANKAIGKFGVEGILSALKARGRGEGGPVRVLTHCNTGSLATAAYGTALGIVRALNEAGLLAHAYCTETRPYNQGARLTAYELVHDGLPATLIADSAAAALMSAGRVDAVVVGADRVAANGDTANKIGTLSLAILAAHHGIPFFVAAPTTSLDPHLAEGSLIEIEERSPEELTHFRGQPAAAAGIGVWNPAFDVAPAALLEGIVTELGIIPKQGGTFQVPLFLQEKGLLEKTAGASNGIASSIPGFFALDHETIKHYVAERPQVAAHVGPSETIDSWTVREVGDGNINFVYIVEGPKGALCIKQGLPYVRIAPDWPLTQDRSEFEALALREQGRHAQAHVPEVHHYDPRMCLIAMQFLPPPHRILRHALTDGEIFPLLAGHVALFLARTLFKTSLLAMDTASWREAVTRFTNAGMCALTEQVIFKDPYYAAPVNRHTSPQLDAEAAALRADAEAKAAVSLLKAKFMERSQALLHGDMHTGSLMVTQESTYAIDAEFAMYGPIAFDVGKFLAQLLIAFLASDGHSTPEAPRTEQRRWLAQTTRQVWDEFVSHFLALWTEEGHQGEAFPTELFGPGVPAAHLPLAQAQAAFVAELWRDAVGFGGAVIIRRIVGIAHVADFDQIADPEVRAVCERRALRLGRRMLVESESFADVAALVAAADKERQDGKEPYFPL